MTAKLPEPVSLTPDEARMVDAVCNRFEAAWQHGSPPQLEEFLADAASGARNWLLEELLLLEYHYRTQSGQTLSREEYLSRFPSDAALIHQVFERAIPASRQPSTNRQDGRDSARTTAYFAVRNSPDIAAGGRQSVAPTSTKPGDDQRYELLEKIGAGGIGFVYRARDRHLRRELAVKVLQGHYQDHPDILLRFAAEAQIGAQLQHTGIAPVYEMGFFADGSPFLAMKLVRGKTLASILAARQLPSVDQVQLITIFEQVCQAIAYAHARRVVHRDLKPGNIMVGEFGEVQVMDWGLAKVLGDHSPTEANRLPVHEAGSIQTRRTDSDANQSMAGLIVGTPAYMPPEQSLGEIDAIDQRADVFSLGAILCEILTGKPPFIADSPEAMCRLSQRGEVGAAHQRLREAAVDTTLSELAIQCLAAAPSDRPADAGVVAQAIATHLASVEQRLQQERLTAERQKLLVVEERKRRKLWMGLSAVALLAVSLAAIASFVWQKNRADYNQRMALTAQQVEADLAEAKQRTRLGDIPGAWLGWNRAAARQGLQALPGLHREHDQLKLDLELSDELDEVRLQRVMNKGRDDDAVLAGYDQAFATYGLLVATEQLESLSQRMNASIVKNSLLAALHDWTLVCDMKRRDAPDDMQRQQWHDRRNRLLQLIGQLSADRRLDPIYDPSNWVRGKLDEFSRQLNPAEETPHLLITLGYLLSDESREALWRSGQASHPNDFWMNASLAVLLDDKLDEDAIGYYRAALALRPDLVPVLNNLGACLFEHKRFDEAQSCLDRAIALDPECWNAYGNLGNVWTERGKLDLAIECFEVSLRLHPDARILCNLAQVHYLNDDRDAAVAALGEAQRLAPESAEPHKNLGLLFEHYGELDKAIDSFRRAVELNAESTELREHFGAMLHQQGSALLKQGESEKALEHFQETLKIFPQEAAVHVNLGMTLLDLGRIRESLDSLQQAMKIGVEDESRQKAIQRRIKELERMAELTDQLAAIVTGELAPASVTDGLEYARVCYYTQHYAASARIYADTFRRDAQSATVMSRDRQFAVVAAAMAGCGNSQGSPTLNDTNRQELRHQALNWLREALTDFSRQLDEGAGAAEADMIREIVRQWREMAHFAPVRDTNSLSQLPTEEQPAWQQFWQDVTSMETRLSPTTTAESQ